MNAGLVSISFRALSPEAVICSARNAGLKNIEWGSDVHAPQDQGKQLAEIVTLQERYGVSCCSYGTYFRLGVNDLEALPSYIRAAKMLGTDILRLWCFNKSTDDVTPEEKAYLFDQCKKAAKIAEENGVTLCLECHKKTYTETKEGALELMQAVNSSAFRMYWQPNQDRTEEENIAYIRLLRDYITHIHVFQWKESQKFPLRSGIGEWKRYLEELGGEHMCLLEFMPDNRVESLPEEAAALMILTGGEI